MDDTTCSDLLNAIGMHEPIFRVSYWEDTVAAFINKVLPSHTETRIKKKLLITQADAYHNIVMYDIF